MIEESKISDEIGDNNKNKNNIRCQFCYSLILKKREGDYLIFEEDFELPLMHQKHTKDVNIIETEPQRHFWVIGDMFNFENIGVSHTVDNKKYLTCADCDMGPVGYHDIQSKKCYVALNRVRHGDALEDVMENDEGSKDYGECDDETTAELDDGQTSDN